MAANIAVKYHPARYSALLLAVLLAFFPSTEALRRFTPDDTKAAGEVKRKAASADLTSYGQPLAELTSKPTSIDHFGLVRSLPSSLHCNVDFTKKVWLQSLTSRYVWFRPNTPATRRTK